MEIKFEPIDFNRKIVIYGILHKDSKKIYVGSSKNFINRWNDHKYELRSNIHHTPHLQNAWNKYGSEAFEFGILEYVDDISKLIEREQYWMDYYKSYERDKGYNVAPKAYSKKGVEVSEKTRKLLSKACKGKKRSKEQREGMSRRMQGIKLFLGHKHSDETKLKMGKASKGHKRLVGFEHSEEAVENMCKAQKLNWEKKLREGSKPHYKKEFWIELDTATKTLVQLSQITGLKIQQVSDWLHRFDLPFFCLLEHPIPKAHSFKEYWVNLDTNNKTLKQLEAETGLTYNAVHKYLKRFGLSYITIKLRDVTGKFITQIESR